MKRNRFVVPDTVKLDLSDGDWLLVKRRLNQGEQDEAFERMYLKHPSGDYVTSAEGKLVVDPRRVATATITAYLLDWSFTDGDGQPIAIVEKPVDEVVLILRSLTTTDFAEVRDAIDAHEKAIEAERQAQKKIPDAAPASLVTSSSPDAVTGATSGSVN